MPFWQQRGYNQRLSYYVKSEKQIHGIVYTWNLKCGINEPIHKTDTENRLVITKGEEATERAGPRVCSGCKLLHMEWLTPGPTVHNREL